MFAYFRHAPPRPGLSGEWEWQEGDGGRGDTDGNVVLLEVTAYPMRSPRRKCGCQRVVLTAESLWHRRGQTIFDKPPAGGFEVWRNSALLAGRNLEARREEAYMPFDVRGSSNPGGINRDGDGGVRHGGGSGSGEGSSRSVVGEALDDLVKMVTFGPPPAVDSSSGDDHRLGGCRGDPILTESYVGFYVIKVSHS